MTLSLYLTVAGRSPQRHATLPTRRKVRSTAPYYKVLRQQYFVQQSTTPVPLRTTKIQYYKVLLCTTKYYKVLLQYGSVPQGTSPAVLRAAKYCCSTTLYYSSTAKSYSSTTLSYSYEVLLHYYAVLQSKTPVLPRTTKYYSSTMYYKVLLQYHKVLVQQYSVLQSTAAVLPCTTKYYSSTTPYYKDPVPSTTKYSFVLQSTTSTTAYYKVLLQYGSVPQSASPAVLGATKYCCSTTVLQSTTPVPLRTTKYYSSTTKYYSSTTPYYKVRLCTTNWIYRWDSVYSFKGFLNWWSIHQGVYPQVAHLNDLVDVRKAFEDAVGIANFFCRTIYTAYWRSRCFSYAWTRPVGFVHIFWWFLDRQSCCFFEAYDLQAVHHISNGHSVGGILTHDYVVYSIPSIPHLRKFYSTILMYGEMLWTKM